MISVGEAGRGPKLDSDKFQNGAKMENGTLSSASKRGFEPVGGFADKYRYFILVLGWLCLTSISSNMISLNFTLICMSPPSISSNGLANASDAPQPISSQNKERNIEYYNENVPVFDYSNRDKAFLMWSVAIGTMVGTFPFSVLYTRYGARYVLFFAGVLSTVSTALIPPIAVIGLPYFLVLRFIQPNVVVFGGRISDTSYSDAAKQSLKFEGVAYSADFAAMGVLCSRWASLKQNALFISVLTCYSPLSSTITNPVAGMLCQSRFGWPMVYYSHAVVCAVLFGFWICFYEDHPRLHKYVSDVELEKIHRDKSEAHINMDKFVPYKAILTTKLVWVIWLNAFADLFSGMFLLMYQPSYFKYVLNYSIEKTGFLGALPTFAHMPLKFVFGFMTERNKLIIFNSIAVALPGVAYATVGFIPLDNPIYTVLLFTAILMFFASSGGGFYKCATLCGRQYSHFIVANIQFVKCLTLFLAPALMNIFVVDETAQDQWRNIFLIMAVMLILAHLLFWLEVSDEAAEFTKITLESWKLKKERKLKGAENDTFLLK